MTVRQLAGITIQVVLVLLIADTAFTALQTSNGFVLAGLAGLLLAVLAGSWAYLRYPGSTRLLKPAEGLAVQPAQHWVFGPTSTWRTGGLVRRYSVVMIDEDDYVSVEVIDRKAAERVIDELRASGTSKSYAEAVVTGTIPDHLKTASTEEGFIDSITKIEVGREGVWMHDPGYGVWRFPVPGRTAHDKFAIVKDLVDEILPGATPRSEIESRKIWPDREILVFE